jgi:hypothetical protein
MRVLTVLTAVCVLSLAQWSQGAEAQDAGNDAATATPDVGELLRAEKFDEAMRALDAMTRADPENPRPYVQMGFTAHALGRYDEAVEAYTRGIELGAKNANISYNLACAHAMAGNPDAACHALDEAVELGFAQTQLIAHDSDLASLRALPRFQSIVAKANELGGPCDRDENYRRFDFWIGEWAVESATGQQVGTNTISRVSEGCALLEHWISAGGGSGRSITYYDPASDRWKQTWVGGSGDIMEFVEVDEADRDGDLRFIAPYVAADGTPGLRRMTFYRMDEGRVRQHIEVSADEGGSWTSMFDGTYIRQTTSEENSDRG